MTDCFTEKDTEDWRGPDTGQGKLAGKWYGWDQTRDGMSPQVAMSFCQRDNRFHHLGCGFRPSETPEGTSSYPEEGQ